MLQIFCPNTAIFCPGLRMDKKLPHFDRKIVVTYLWLKRSEINIYQMKMTALSCVYLLFHFPETTLRKKGCRNSTPKGAIWLSVIWRP